MVVEISEDDSAANVPIVHGVAVQMGPPPPCVPAPGSSTVGSSTPASAPSSQPSSSCDPENGDPENHPSKRPKVGAKKSWVWDHFIENFTPGYAKCKYCPATYKAGGKRYGTSNLDYHLKKQCTAYKKTLKVEDGQQTLEFQPCGLGEDPQLVAVSFSQDACRRALIRFIVTDEMSFRMVEGEGFRAFCRHLEPKFKVPSRMTVYRDVCKLFLSERTNLINYFKTNKVRVCLTTDTWTSLQNYNYMVVTSHFIDHHWKLHKRIICFCLIDSHEGENIGKVLEKCLLQWGLERVSTVTLDNVSANRLAIEYLKKRVTSWGSSILKAKFLHVRCAAHILALVVKDGMKKYHTSVLRVRAVVKYVTSTPAREKKFKDAVLLQRIECKKGLVLDVKTRWNSTYLMLDAAEKYEKAFLRLRETDRGFSERFCWPCPEPSNIMGDGNDAVDLDADFELINDIPEEEVEEDDEEDMEEEERPSAAHTKGKKKIRSKVHAPEHYDWSNARCLVQFLKVFYAATVEFSASTSVTSHTMLLELGNVRRELEDWKNNYADPFLSHMGQVMLTKYNKYWGSYEKMNPFMFSAVLLDPREKERGLYVTVEDLVMHHDPVIKQRKVRSWMDKVKKDFNDLYAAYKSEYLQNRSECSSSTESVGDTNSCASQGSLDSSSSKKAKYLSERKARISQLSNVQDHGRSEVDRYLVEPVYTPTSENAEFEILQWWKVNAARFDILSLMAKDIFAIPISSVASESAFSTGKRILDPFRSSLKPRTLEALILLQNWLREPIDMNPYSLGVDEDEVDSLESELFGDLSASSIIIDED